MNLLIYLLYLCVFSVILAKYSTDLVENPNESTSRYWIGICTSSSGEYVAASGYSGVFTSSNYGFQWKLSLAGTTWEGIACSSSGSQLCTVSYSGGIFISLDYGSSWNNVSSIGGYAVASSASGQYLYIAGSQGISSSVNYGGNWSSVPFTIIPKTVACSASGQYVATAGSDEGFVYFSNDFGASFNISYQSREMWSAISMDSTGQYVTAAGSDKLYISSNFGSTWTLVKLANIEWTTIATSADGSFRIAGSYYEGYYYSLDYGVQWVGVSDDLDWTGMTTSASGQYIYGVVYRGGIYGNFYAPTSQPSKQPTSQPSRRPTTQPTMSPTRYQEYSYTLVEMDSTVLYYLRVASSSSGQYIFAATESSDIVVSTNFGNSIAQMTVGISEWTDITCSSTGQYVYVVTEFSTGYVYYSSDYGSSWSQLPWPNKITQWGAIATNASGQSVYAYATEPGVGYCMYYSRNFGFSWNCTAIPVVIQAVACSTSGQYVSAVSFDSYLIYWSDDFGLSYHESDAEIQSWISIAVSNSGQYQIACGYAAGDGVFTSSNYGVNWTVTVLPAATWGSVTISGTGQYMFAAMDETHGNVYSSVDFGVTWSLTESPEQGWTGLTVSSNGEHLVGVVQPGGLFTNQYSIPTSAPSSQPSSQPNAAPSTVPSTQPTSHPSLQPHTSFPTSQPSVCPSRGPSSQPSSYPSYVPDSFDTSSAVLSYTANSSFTFNHLGCGSQAFVSASVLVSYLDATTSGYISVWAATDSESVLVSDNCAPSSVCGSVVCAVNVNVTSVVSCSGGGSVTLFASTVNADKQSGVDTLCTYLGTPGIQYALSYQISVNPLPTAQPTTAPTISGPGNLVFEASPNTPFYVIVTITLLFMALGVVLVRLRDKSGTALDSLKVTSTCTDLGMIGYHLASEVFYIDVLFTSNLTALAALILVIRLSSMLPTLYFLIISVGPSQFSYHYSGQLDKPHLIKNASVYSVVILVMLLEQTVVRYFPWSRSEYVRQSRGFPDQWIFQCCMSFKFVQLLASLIIQIVVLSYSDAYLFRDRADKIALALVLLYLVSSVLTVVMFAITNLVRWKAGSESGTDDVSGADKMQNPLYMEDTGTELTSMKREESKGTGYVTREYLEEREALLQQTMEDRQTELRREFERREAQWSERWAQLESRLDEQSKVNCSA